MNTNNFKSIAVSRFCIAGIASNTKLIALMLLTLILSVSTIAQADGLFDFQMKLAQKGNAEAQFKVGEMYETGFGVKEDKTERVTLSVTDENGCTAMDEILVTATAREASVQDIPYNISAMSGDVLESQNMVDQHDVLRSQRDHFLHLVATPQIIEATH